MNFVPAEIESREGAATVQVGGKSVPFEHRDSVPQAGPATLGIRPEHLSVANGREPDFEAKIEIVEKLGAESLIYLQTDFSAEPVTMRISPDHQIRPGDSVPVHIERSKMHLFDPQGRAI